jgi:hypothetical protein
MPVADHTLYDIAKDFQPAVAALIALSAAGVAWYVGMARIAYDRKVAAFERVSRRLGICLRLRSRAEYLQIAATTFLRWLTDGPIDPDRCYELLRIWPVAPEVDEAWKVIEGMPPDVIERFARFRTCQLEIAAYAVEPQAKWLDDHRTYSVTMMCNEMVAVYDQLKPALDAEIRVLERERNHLHRRV